MESMVEQMREALIMARDYLNFDREIVDAADECDRHAEVLIAIDTALREAGEKTE